MGAAGRGAGRAPRARSLSRAHSPARERAPPHARSPSRERAPPHARSPSRERAPPRARSPSRERAPPRARSSSRERAPPRARSPAAAGIASARDRDGAVAGEPGTCRRRLRCACITMVGIISLTAMALPLFASTLAPIVDPDAAFLPSLAADAGIALPTRPGEVLAARASPPPPTRLRAAGFASRNAVDECASVWCVWCRRTRS